MRQESSWVLQHYLWHTDMTPAVSWGAGVIVGSPATWMHLMHWDPLIKLIPAILSTLLLMIVMGRFKSPLALPCVLVAIPGFFFIALACLRQSLADAQSNGWVAKPAVITACHAAITLLSCMCHHIIMPFICYTAARFIEQCVASPVSSAYVLVLRTLFVLHVAAVAWCRMVAGSCTAYSSVGFF